jgi:hypothetical protein
MTDISQFQTWLEGGQAPTSVSSFVFDPDDLYTTTTKQRAVYRGLMCLVLRSPSLDFHSTQPISAALIEQNHIDDHHIFPKGYLRSTAFKVPVTDNEVDCILNRTLIDKETNMRIGMNPPSVYLNQISNDMKQDAEGNSVLEKILESHKLPIGQDSPLWKDDFIGFQIEREQALFGLIENAVKNG